MLPFFTPDLREEADAVAGTAYASVDGDDHALLRADQVLGGSGLGAVRHRAGPQSLFAVLLVTTHHDS